MWEARAVCWRLQLHKQKGNKWEKTSNRWSVLKLLSSASYRTIHWHNIFYSHPFNITCRYSEVKMEVVNFSNSMVTLSMLPRMNAAKKLLIFLSHYPDHLDISQFCSGWCSSVGWALSRALKGCWFSCRSGHMPWLQTQSCLEAWRRQ